MRGISWSSFGYNYRYPMSRCSAASMSCSQTTRTCIFLAHASSRAPRLRSSTHHPLLLPFCNRPSGANNPREISNTIKAFFISKKRDEVYISQFKQFLLTNKDSLDIINAVTLADGCARVGVSLYDITSWEALEEMMSKFNFMVSSSTVNKAFSALGSLRLDEAKTKKYLGLLWAAVKHSKVTLTPTETCNCLYQLQSLSISSHCLDINRFLSYFSKSLDSSKAPLPPKIVCSAIYGLRKLKPTTETRYLVSALTRKVNECEMYYHSINVCIALNGLQVRTPVTCTSTHSLPSHPASVLAE